MIYCFGDSLTYGYGVAPRECWPVLLAELGGKKCVNLGVNGDTTSYVLQRIKAHIKSHEYEKGSIAIVMAGENDVLMYGANGYDVQNVLTACECLKGAGATPIAVVQPGFVPSRLPFYGGMDVDKLNQNHDAFADALLEECNSRGIITVDLRRVFGNRTDLYIDGVHLTPEGHWMIAEAMNKELALL